MLKDVLRKIAEEFALSRSRGVTGEVRPLKPKVPKIEQANLAIVKAEYGESDRVKFDRESTLLCDVALATPSVLKVAPRWHIQQGFWIDLNTTDTYDEVIAAALRTVKSGTK